MGGKEREGGREEGREKERERRKRETDRQRGDGVRERDNEKNVAADIIPC